MSVAVDFKPPRWVSAAGCAFLWFAAAISLSLEPSHAQDSPTLWEEILRHAPETTGSAVTTPPTSTISVSRIHRESPTADIIAALDAPDAPEGIWDLAVQRLAAEGRVDELDELLDRCLREERDAPVHQTCVFHKAITLAKAGEYESASALLESALAYQELGASRSVMALNLAELSVALGDFDSARILYGRLANIQHQTLSMHLGRAMLALKEGNFREARTHMAGTLADPDAEQVLLGGGSFYVPDGDVHLVQLLFSMIAGDGDGARLALREWSETPSAESPVNRLIRQEHDELSDRIEARVQRLALPSDCYPSLVAPFERGRRIVAVCSNQTMYELDASVGMDVADNATLVTDFSESRSTVADIRSTAANQLRVLFESGLVWDLTRTGETWRRVQTVDLGAQQTLAVQLLPDDSVLLLHINGNGYSVVPIADDVGVGALLTLGNGRALPTVAFGSSGDIGVSNDTNQAYVFETESQTVMSTLNLATPYEMNRMALSSDEQRLAVLTDGRVSLYSLSTLELTDLWLIRDSSGVVSIRWSADGNTLFVATNSAAFRLSVDD